MKIIDRLKRLEAERSPLARAYALVGRGVPPSLWTDAELESFCDIECGDLADVDESILATMARGFTGSPQSDGSPN